MNISSVPPIHLTYCLNVHPGESWQKNLDAIKTYTLPIRNRVAPKQSFGLGLRLSAAAAAAIDDPRRIEEFKAFLEKNNLYVFTINGFPYGGFHNTSVKENVYRPDWSAPERVEYTQRLARILSSLLPEGVPGSINTVPVTYAPWATEDVLAAAVGHLGSTASFLREIEEKTGKEIILALEPEPDCFLQTIDEVLAFFAGPLSSIPFADQYIGICLDASHQAVQFEDPADDIERLSAAGVRIGKIHLSAALSLDPTPENIRRLKDFADDVYLHQVRGTAPGGIPAAAFGDLPEAIGTGSISGEREWRIHFHVPLFMEECGGLQSTAGLLTGKAAELMRGGASPHLEIETYTWSVLPDAGQIDIVDGIVEEITWVLDNVLLPDP